MSKYLAKHAAVVNHTLLAVGAALLAGLAVIPESGPIDWRHAAITATGTLLTALGAGYFYRQSPPK